MTIHLGIKYFNDILEYLIISTSYPRKRLIKNDSNMTKGVSWTIYLQHCITYNIY